MTNTVELVGYYGSDETHALSAWTSTSRELTDDKAARIPKLLKMLADNGHHTPFEKSSLHFLVTCDQASHIHLLKHRIGVSCISGDTMIHIPKPGGGVDRISIKSLYERYLNGIVSRSKNGREYRRKDPRLVPVRTFDPDTNLIGASKIRHVFYNGRKDVYRFTLSDGKFIECTDDHRFYVKDKGWSPIGESVGLEMRNGCAGMTIDGVQVAVNGVMERPWVERSFFADVENKMTRVQAAAHLGMSYENLKKWGYVHNIGFLPNENKYFKLGFNPWNKGFAGYKAPRQKNGLRPIESRNGYASEKTWRAAIGNWTRQQLPALLKKFNYVCQGPLSEHDRSFEAHHLIPVKVDPSFACDFDNLVPLCKDCHKYVHRSIKHTADFEAAYRKREAPITMKYLKPRKGRRLQAHYVSVVSVEHLGVQDVYDMEVDGTHNYVAGGIILHNCNAESARYKELKEDKIYLPEDWKGIPVSEVSDDSTLGADWYTMLKVFSEGANELYHKCLEDLTPVLGRKRAKESARFFKTMNSQITMDVMFNWRSFYHFQSLRSKPDAQMEIAEIADKMLELVENIEGKPFEYTIKAFGL